MIELEKWLENTNIVKDNIHVAVYFVSRIIVVKCIVTRRSFPRLRENRAIDSFKRGK